jgi:type IV pilus assembly protein PilP
VKPTRETKGQKKGRRRVNAMTPSSAYKLVIGLGLLVLVAGGCAKEEETSSRGSPAVVRKSVTPKKAVAQKSGAARVVKTVKSEAQKAAVEAPSTAESGSGGLTQEATAEAAAPGEKSEKGADEKMVLAKLYDPKGRPDPFLPPSSRMRPSDLPKKRVRKQKLPLTPLQKIDLTQLAIVGIIVSPTGNKALVEEPSGKGYVITRGTYVGQNYGRVKRILPDRVVVEEEIEDFFSGEMRLKTSELLLQKKLGET